MPNAVTFESALRKFGCSGKQTSGHRLVVQNIPVVFNDDEPVLALLALRTTSSHDILTRIYNGTGDPFVLEVDLAQVVSEEHSIDAAGGMQQLLAGSLIPSSVPKKVQLSKCQCALYDCVLTYTSETSAKQCQLCQNLR